MYYNLLITSFNQQTLERLSFLWFPDCEIKLIIFVAPSPRPKSQDQSQSASPTKPSFVSFFRPEFIQVQISFCKIAPNSLTELVRCNLTPVLD